MSDIGLRERIAFAIYDPGYTEGARGERDTVEWQAAAVMRVIYEEAASHSHAPLSRDGENGMTPTEHIGEAYGSGKRVEPPFERQCFTSFQEWVNKASSWLTRHPEYNNTEHGETKGWRGRHFTSMCFDSLGRRCRNGADFQRAHDEGAFPVWWVWPDQIVEFAARAHSPNPASEPA